MPKADPPQADKGGSDAKALLPPKGEETQIEIAKRLPLGKNLDYSRIDKPLNEVMRMLNKMVVSLRS